EAHSERDRERHRGRGGHVRDRLEDDLSEADGSAGERRPRRPWDGCHLSPLPGVASATPHPAERSVCARHAPRETTPPPGGGGWSVVSAVAEAPPSGRGPPGFVLADGP